MAEAKGKEAGGYKNGFEFEMVGRFNNRKFHDLNYF